MSLNDEFRERAYRCLALAESAPSIEARTHWLSMAQLWFNLVEYAEAQDEKFVRDAGVNASTEIPRADLRDDEP